MDGKTLRGARRDGRQVHVLAAMEHTSRRVLAQREVDGAPSEVPGFRPLLADLDLTGAVVTADALKTHAEAAEFLVTVKQADYLFIVKANQPTLLDRCAGLPWHQVPALDRTRDQAMAAWRFAPQGCHGRWVRLPAHRSGPPGHPQDPQPAHPQVAHHDRLRGHQPHLPAGQPRPARRSAARALGNRERAAPRAGRHFRRGRLPGPHRDRPAVMALRNLAIGALCRAGPVHLAAALHQHARDPRRPLATLGITLG